jgi:GrpB-like predicted nucleotidyltransferase (UPF0157 family)
MPDEPVRIVPHDPLWAERFAEVRGHLEALLARWLTGGVHHIGSTAVPGLDATPTVDVMAGVSSLEDSRKSIPLLEAEGWLYAPCRPDEHWFCRPSPARREYHLHLVRTNAAGFRRRLRFRDALRADGALAARYAALRHDLARRFPNDREAYTEAKRDFIEAALAPMKGKR